MKHRVKLFSWINIQARYIKVKGKRLDYYFREDVRVHDNG